MHIRRKGSAGACSQALPFLLMYTANAVPRCERSERSGRMAKHARHERSERSGRMAKHARHERSERRGSMANRCGTFL